MTTWRPTNNTLRVQRGASGPETFRLRAIIGWGDDGG